MKKWFIVLLSLLLCVCSVSQANGQYYKEKERIPYEIVANKQQLPKEVKTLYDKQHKQFKVYTVRRSGVTYVVIHLGERKTGGYGVKVTDVRYKKGKAIVYYKEQKPAPNALVTQVLTYPKVAIKLKTTIQIEIKRS